MPASCWSCSPLPLSSSSHTSWRKLCTRHSVAAGSTQQQHHHASSTPTKAMAIPPSSLVVQARISVAASTGSLDLSDCCLEEVPSEIFNLTDLEHLSLADNNLFHIPDRFQSLTNLRRLGLSGNWLSELPSTISKLHRLEGLWVQGNLLQSLPNKIGDLRMLEILALTGNRLAKIPESVSSLSSLRSLSLSGNRLDHLPSSLGDMVALRTLSLNGNSLQLLPTSIQRLSQLEVLSLQGNRIQFLPPDLCGLRSLKQLCIADNELLGLPNSVADMQSLESLSLYGNKVTELSNNVYGLKGLQSLWLEGNPLQTLPEPLLASSNLKAIGVDSDMVLLPKLQARLGNSLQVCKLVGSGRATSLGGYFKLRPSRDLSSLAEVVVVAFGSAPGVPNWGGLLKRLRAAMQADNLDPAFDILFVVDTRRSWYTETKYGEDGQPEDRVGGHEEQRSVKLCTYYYQELQEALKGYKRVIMIGDSMGASASLMFSQLATSVIAFCPQVDLVASAIRPGRDKSWLSSYTRELLDAVTAASAHITVHCGTWEHDLYQAKLLPESRVNLVVHDNDDHRLTKELVKEGSLLRIVRTKVEEEIAAAHGMHLPSVTFI